MEFNASKRNVLSVSRIPNPVHFTYPMGNITLNHVTSQSDIGFEVVSTLEWTTHINQNLRQRKPNSGYNQIYMWLKGSSTGNKTTLHVLSKESG